MEKSIEKDSKVSISKSEGAKFNIREENSSLWEKFLRTELSVTGVVVAAWYCCCYYFTYFLSIWKEFGIYFLKDSKIEIRKRKH